MTIYLVRAHKRWYNNKLYNGHIAATMHENIVGSFKCQGVHEYYWIPLWMDTAS